MLSFHVGVIGKPSPSYPGFGFHSGECGCRKVRHRPMWLQGVTPLKTAQETLTSNVARLLMGLAVVAVASSQLQAQQYVYYPQASNQPTYYYVQQPATQYYQTAYAPQNYQYYYPPQYYQTPQYYQAPAVTPTTTDGAQVIPASYTAPAAETYASQTPQAAPAQSYGDPYGFLSWLNATRASYGLGAVSYDQNLSNWAAMNNDQQMARGLGHFVMGPARRQNSAMGGGFPGAMWMGSPAHRAALLDPTISWIGIAAAGAYWTFNAN